MYEFDLTTLSGYLSALWQTFGAVLGFDPDIFVAIHYTQGHWRLVIGVLMVAGISDMLGHSVILFANRVSKPRFLASLGMNVFLFILTVLSWGIAIWMMGLLILEAEHKAIPTLENVWFVVGLSFAPFIYGFLTLIPYLGNIIHKVLRVWQFLIIWQGAEVVFGAGPWQSLLAALLGLAALEFLHRISFLRIDKIDDWLWRLATGKQDMRTPGQLVDQFAAETGAELAEQYHITDKGSSQ